jgi:predicted DNA-binding transcriptional regulator YafY
MMQPMRASRLLGMLITLQLRGRMPASALARAFEVSVRTIYRDVDALSAAGVPIYAETGRNGGVQLHDGYRTRLTGLTAHEAAALPLAGLTHAARGLGMSGDAASAGMKMLASLAPDAAAAAGEVAARFHVDPIPWYHVAEDPDCLPALAAAVWRGRRIVATYQSWKGRARRTLDPLGLVQKGGLWYLVAAWRGRAGTYRVSNLDRLCVLDVPAVRPARFDLGAHWARSCAQFEAQLLSRVARVRISHEGERIARATMPLAAAMIARTATPDPQPGWSLASMPVEADPQAARQLLALGRDVEVLAPESLRAAWLGEASAIVAHFGDGSR